MLRYCAPITSSKVAGRKGPGLGHSTSSRFLPVIRRVKPVAGSAKSASTDNDLDVASLAKYAGALSSQVALMTGALWSLQQLTSGPLAEYEFLCNGAVAAFFFTISLKSRIFSTLDARRPTLSDNDPMMQRKRPSWQPPRIVFPIVWSCMALLRTASAYMVWESQDHTLLQLPLVLFVTHLAIGDVWNHINNVEQRLGVAVPGVFSCLASAIVLDASYFQVNTTAGYVLFPLCVWLTVASALIYSTWELNGKQPLYPTKGTALVSSSS